MSRTCLLFRGENIKNSLKRQFSSINSHSKKTRCASTPLRLAVIGSGPAGFYTAYHMLKEYPSTLVDMYEALPVPFGLVRHGVAPDHPEVKNVQHRFDEVARDPRYAFIGNVKYGKELGMTDLRAHYDAIVFSCGASQDRSLGIKNESIGNILSARAFVGWYNGLPQHRDLQPDLTCTDTAVIIGHGNVALDVSRMLLTDTAELSKTDITEYALEVSFTAKELREMMRIPNTRFHTDFDLLKKEISSSSDYISNNRPLKRLMQILESGRSNSTGEKSWTLKFLRSPTEFIICDDIKSQNIHSVKLGVNELEGPPEKRVAVPTGVTEEIETGLIVKSLGYTSTPLDGVPFDEKRGIVPNDKGKVLNLDGIEVPGLYVSGWLKSGARGVIATTMYDAFETADVIVSDLRERKPMLSNIVGDQAKLGAVAILPILDERGVRTVSYEDWKKIEEKEIEVGRQRRKPREKCGSVEEALKMLD